MEPTFIRIELYVSHYKGMLTPERSIEIDEEGIRVLSRFIDENIRGDHVLAPIREIRGVLKQGVYRIGYKRGWDHAKAGHPISKPYDPVMKDGYEAGYDDCLQDIAHGTED